MRQPKRLKILNVDNVLTLDELETLKERLFHLKINEDGPVAMKLRLLEFIWVCRYRLLYTWITQCPMCILKRAQYLFFLFKI